MFVLGSGFWVLGSGFWVLGSGFWAKIPSDILVPVRAGVGGGIMPFSSWLCPSEHVSLYEFENQVKKC